MSDQNRGATGGVSGQLANTESTRAAIVDHARVLACRADIEYPGYIEITALNGRIGQLGTANGPWQCDVYTPARTAPGMLPAASVTVPDSHAGTAEGIARFVVGTLAGLSEYRAYASAAEQRTADRPLKGGRR